jgi:enamidase
MQTLITNIGVLVAGDGSVQRDTSLSVDDGLVADIGGDLSAPDVVIDARGQTVMPGLVDGHVHPTVGDWTPAQNSVGWIRNYLHGGVTSMVSAGELHVPGLPFDQLTPELVFGLACLSRATLSANRGYGPRVEAGTLLLVPGMSESMFDRMAEAGLRHLKFIFYDWARLEDGEALDYVRWARERSMIVKIHSGGVSRSGSSRVAGYDVVQAVGADVVGHISGGPIPMPDDEIRRVIDDVPHAAVEICSSMNYRATKVTVDHLMLRGQLDRMTVGTDTPGGTGVIPRGMLRNICYLSSVCGVAPELAVAAATGVTAGRHGLDQGVIAPGRPADLVILGPITGSGGKDALECFALGDLPGISTVLVDGAIVVEGRSEQTPPPTRPAQVRRLTSARR